MLSACVEVPLEGEVKLCGIHSVGFTVQFSDSSGIHLLHNSRVFTCYTPCQHDHEYLTKLCSFLMGHSVGSYS